MCFAFVLVLLFTEVVLVCCLLGLFWIGVLGYVVLGCCFAC